MNVVLSIKPQFAEKILNGDKKYEFRRTIFKKYVSKVIIYATAPVSKVVGEFLIEKIIKLPINELWEQTKEHGGISYEYFMNYFEGKEYGFAIKVKSSLKYNTPTPIQYYGVPPPQSFAYSKFAPKSNVSN